MKTLIAIFITSWFIYAFFVLTNKVKKIHYYYESNKYLGGITIFLGIGAVFTGVISTIILGVILLNSLLGYRTPAQRETDMQFSLTNGTWIAADNSFRMHFFLDGLSDFYENSSNPRKYVIVADLQTGSAQLISYSLSNQNHYLNFSGLNHILLNEYEEDYTPVIKSDLPSEFSIIEFGKDSLVVQIMDHSPLRFFKTTSPSSSRELADYFLKYSTEELLSVVVANFHDWVYQNPIGDMTFERSSGGKYNIYINRVQLKYDSSTWEFTPGLNALLIIPPLKNLLSPISGKIEAIYYTEVFGSMKHPPDGVHWTARYTMSSSTPELIEDTTIGWKVHLDYIEIKK